MALTIPYTSREGIGRTPDAAGARPAPAEAFYNAGAAAAAKGLGNLANAAQGLNMQAHAETLRLREEELSLDMLKDMQAYQTEAAQFQDDYRANFQGENARDAAGQATAFHREKLQVLRETYGHNPQALQYVERHGGSLAASGVNAARAYGLGEHAKYKDSVHAGELELARGKLANWNTPPEEKAALYADLQKKTAALYGSRGLDGTAAGEKLAVFYKDCETQGQKEKLAYLRETDPAAAHKQVQEALTAFAPGGTAAGSGPRGIRNHNPGNIRRTDSPWEGEVAGADGNFKSFATPEHGIAALGNNLLAYEKKGITTVQGIINRWAPPVENDTGAYVARVAKELGVAPDASLNLHDPAVLAGLSRAIIAHENGGNPYTDAQVRAGVQAALGKAPLPAPQTIAPGTLVADAGNTPGGTGTDAGGGFGAPRQDAPLALSPEAALLARTLTPQQLAVELRTSEGELRRRETETKQQAAVLLHDKDNYLSFAMQTGNFSPVKKLEGQLLALGQADAALDLKETRTLYQTAEPILKGAANEPILQQMERVESTFKDMLRPDNAAKVEKVQGMVMRGLHQKLDAFRKDPAGMVAEHPLLQEEGLTEGQKTERSLRLQRELGAGTDMQPRVLPAGQAKALKDSYDSMQDAGEKAHILAGLGVQYGKYAGQAFAEAKLPGAVIATATIMPELSKATAARLVAAAESKEGDLPPLDAMGKRNLAETVASSPFVKTLGAVSVAMFTSQEQQSFNVDMGQTLEKYMRLGGKLEDIESKFAILNDSGMAIIAPGGTDTKLLEKALQAKRSALVESSSAIGEGRPDLQRQYAHTNYKSMYADGVWVFDGQGYSLVDTATGRIAIDGEQKPVRIMPGDVPALARDYKHNWSATNSEFMF